MTGTGNGMRKWDMGAMRQQQIGDRLQGARYQIQQRQHCPVKVLEHNAIHGTDDDEGNNLT